MAAAQEIIIIGDTIKESELSIYMEKLTRDTNISKDIIEYLVTSFEKENGLSIKELDIKNLISLSKLVEQQLYRREVRHIQNRFITPEFRVRDLSIKELLKTAKTGGDDISVGFGEDILTIGGKQEWTIAQGTPINLSYLRFNDLKSAFLKTATFYKNSKKDIIALDKHILLSIIYDDVVQDNYFTHVRQISPHSEDINTVNIAKWITYYKALLSDITSKEAFFLPYKSERDYSVYIPFIAPIIHSAKKSPQIARLEEGIKIIKFPRNETALLSVIYQLDIMKNYLSSLKFGEDNDDTFIKRIEQAIAYKEIQHAVLMDMLEKENKSNTYLLLILEVFGEKRHKMVQKHIAENTTIKLDPDNILQLLQPKEQKIIQEKYRARIKYFYDLVNNKCPHVKLLKMIDPAKYKKFLSDLHYYIPPGDRKDGIIQCSKLSWKP